MVAGGRFGAAGETTTGHGPREICIPEGCQNRVYASKTSLLSSTAENRLAKALAPILGAGLGARLPGGRPLHPSRPPATICQPSGLNCENAI